jgi:hypothetical protein
MSAYAYRCRSCESEEADWFVSLLAAEELGPAVRIVRVRVGSEWKCAVLDRSERVAVENQLLRDVIASDAEDCPQCVEMSVRRPTAVITENPDAETVDQAARDLPAQQPAAPTEEVPPPGRTIQAAAVSLQGERFLVVVTSRSLVTSPGEADMAIDDLQQQFGGVPVVLMAQRDDGLPSYYGARRLVDLLSDVPLERMPWKEYPLG